MPHEIIKDMQDESYSKEKKICSEITIFYGTNDNIKSPTVILEFAKAQEAKNTIST